MDFKERVFFRSENLKKLKIRVGSGFKNSGFLPTLKGALFKVISTINSKHATFFTNYY